MRWRCHGYSVIRWVRRKLFRSTFASGLHNNLNHCKVALKKVITRVNDSLFGTLNLKLIANIHSIFPIKVHMPQSLQISFFLESDQNHGGSKRSLQIAEFLRKENPMTISYNSRTHISTIRTHGRLPHLSIKLLMNCLSTLSFGVTLKGVLYSWYKLIFLYEEVIHRKPDLIFFECSDGLPLIFLQLLISESRCPIHVFPHNIEGLTPHSSNKYFRSTFSKLRYEVHAYAQCHKVICISKFDAYVLRIHGISAKVLPYFPTEGEEVRLKYIADRRLLGIKQKDHFLILGSCANWPTKSGISQLIDHISQISTSAKFIVAGYNTELFMSRQTQNIRVLGEVTGNTLEELLITSIALIVNQYPTSGFVTKIVEANLCNIPILITNDYLQASDLDKYGIFNINISQVEENLNFISATASREYLKFSRNQAVIK